MSRLLWLPYSLACRALHAAASRFHERMLVDLPDHLNEFYLEDSARAAIDS